MKKYNLNKKKFEQLNFYGIDIMDSSNSAVLISKFIENNPFKNKESYLNILAKYISRKNSNNLKPVSYTHLTLPTTPYV